MIDQRPRLSRCLSALCALLARATSAIAPRRTRPAHSRVRRAGGRARRRGAGGADVIRMPASIQSDLIVATFTTFARIYEIVQQVSDVNVDRPRIYLAQKLVCSVCRCRLDD